MHDIIKYLFISLTTFVWFFHSCSPSDNLLEKGFVCPPDSARPGVYWYFMDGNRSKEAMTKDLEAMKKAGIRNLLFLEVNLEFAGVPRGPVDFMSEEWQDMFAHAVAECERLGIDITLNAGPGWTGSGGPWVDASQSMLHLVSSSVNLSGPGKQTITLPKPSPKQPFFGEYGFTPEVKEQWEDYYEDVAVLALPEGASTFGAGYISQSPFLSTHEMEEKAIYYRQPYSIIPNIKQYYTIPDIQSDDRPVEKDHIIDLTAQLKPDGTLEWDVPAGRWTVMRFGSRSNGSVTRPAPIPGVGLECDKLDTTALNAHLDQYTEKLFHRIGFKKARLQPGGLKMLHIDSWEMGSQNWTPLFREEFARRRGYDPLPFYPVYAGIIVQSREISERFLWDLRQTSLELIKENHAGHLRQYAQRYGMGLSIEPYEMTPAANLELGSMANMPMCEFWSINYGHNISYTSIEVSSIAHLKGQPIVPAEAFTSVDGWQQYPGLMKNQTDWALAAGITRLVFHTFVHQPFDDSLRPGLTLGPHGVHWDRRQTWWPMVDFYHLYLSRCQFMLQQGRMVADILYLTPEGAPHVFHAPASALEGEMYESVLSPNARNETMIPDRKGHNFDGCPPSLLYDATVRDGCVVFPSGVSYRLLVLPYFDTMTPGLLRKIRDLVNDGATVVGLPPKKSPSLNNYPTCDKEVQELAAELWGTTQIPDLLTTRSFGQGKIIWCRQLIEQVDHLYPPYSFTAKILEQMGLLADFESSGEIRYTHRTMDGCDIYFVSNRTDQPVSTPCKFRVTGSQPELWNPITGEMILLPEYTVVGKQTLVPLQFDVYQGYFVVFRKQSSLSKPSLEKNFPEMKQIAVLNSPWTVTFDPTWGGPSEQVTFEQLSDWSQHNDPGIKYYSGTAIYRQTFNLPVSKSSSKIYLHLGKVKHMTRVRLNGNDLGVLWTAPWSVDITQAVKDKNNQLEIEVVNLWPNRLIGDEQLPDDGIQDGQWPDWLLENKPRTSGRFTFTTGKHYHKDSPLLESGLLGPVELLIIN